MDSFLCRFYYSIYAHYIKQSPTLQLFEDEVQQLNASDIVFLFFFSSLHEPSIEAWSCMLRLYFAGLATWKRWGL